MLFERRISIIVNHKTPGRKYSIAFIVYCNTCACNHRIPVCIDSNLRDHRAAGRQDQHSITNLQSRPEPQRHDSTIFCDIQQCPRKGSILMSAYSADILCADKNNTGFPIYAQHPPAAIAARYSPCDLVFSADNRAFDLRHSMVTSEAMKKLRIFWEDMRVDAAPVSRSGQMVLRLPSSVISCTSAEYAP